MYIFPIRLLPHAQCAFQANPITKQLILETNPTEKHKKESKKKKRRKDESDAPDLATDTAADAEAVESIDKIFLEGENLTASHVRQFMSPAQENEPRGAVILLCFAAFDEKQQRSRKKKRTKDNNEARESEDNGAPSATQPRAEFKTAGIEKDPTLDAALFFIEGTSNTMSKRELARRRKLEVSFALAVSTSDFIA